MSAGGGISFKIPVKAKNAKPAVPMGVAAVFQANKPHVEPPKVLTEDSISECEKVKPSDDKTEKPKESAFLRLLRKRQQGIEPEKPVPVEDSYNENIPIAGFGAKSLREQGLEPGEELGKHKNVDKM